MTAAWPSDLLEQDTAIVTGGGRGIGLAITRALSAAGAHVAIFERDEERLHDALADLDGDRVRGFVTDVADTAAVASSVEATRAAFGEISIVVNNAGITRDAYIRKMTYEQFDEVVAVHLRGAFTLVKECLESMIAGGRGAIVNIASSTGLYGNPGQANYGSAKAGIVGLTRTAAVELARFSIRANAIAPGAIDTPMMQAVGPETVQGFVDLIPAGRLGEPREVADAAVYLASPLSSYVTGHVLIVDGGFTVVG